MSDSVLLQMLLELKVVQDTTLVHLGKVEQLVNGIETESLFPKLLPLIGVVIGGLITWWIQKTLKDKELSLSLLREIRDTTNKILSAITSIQFHLKELAYLEVDSKYQYYLSQTEETEVERKRAMDEHYNDYKYISDVKTRISSCAAEINSNFAAYFKLTNKVFDGALSDELISFTNHILTLRREEEFDTNVEVTTEMLNSKIDSLTVNYTKDIGKLLNSARQL